MRILSIRTTNRAYAQKAQIKNIFVPGGPFDQAYLVFSKKFKIDDLRNLMSVYL